VSLTDVSMREVAMTHHCRLACETAHPRFTHRPHGWIVRLTLNSGYE